MKKGLLALSPLMVFIALYLVTSIIARDFYKVPITVAFLAASVYAIATTRGKLRRRINVFSRGAGTPEMMLMIWIFVLAGAFAHSAKVMGAIDATVNLTLALLPGQMLLAGLFLAACFISLSIGTSVGTIVALTPIAAGVASQTGADMALVVAVVVGGSFFGDNLSFISDTTIAATRTQGVEMKDKFRTNIRVALPAAFVTFCILMLHASVSDGARMGSYAFNIWQALPYFIVLAMSIMGINVFIVLITGCMLFGLVGAATGSLGYAKALSSMGNGISGMFETIIVTLLVASIAALMSENGGFAAVLSLIRKKADSKRGGKTGIALLTMFMDIATANNTVAIVIAAPIAKEISREYGVKPEETASLLDTCSCIAQGIIPYGAQLLVAANIAGLASVSLIPYLIYPFVLAVFVAGSVILEK